MLDSNIVIPLPEDIESFMSIINPDKSKRDLKLYILLQRLYVISRSFVSDRNNILEIDVSNLNEECSVALNEKYPYLGNFSFSKWMQTFIYNPEQSLNEISILLENVKIHYLNNDHFMLKRAKVDFLKEYYKDIQDSDFKKKEDIRNILDIYLYEKPVLNYTRTDLNHNKYLDRVFCFINDYGINYRDFYTLYNEYIILDKHNANKDILGKIIKMLIYFHKNPTDIVFPKINLAEKHFEYASLIRDKFFEYGIFKMEFSSMNIIALINEYIKFPGGAHSSICYGFMDMERKYSSEILTAKDCISLYDEMLFKIEYFEIYFTKKVFLDQINLKIKELDN